MKYEFEFEITKKLLRTATLRYIHRSIGGALLALLIVFIILICFIVSGSTNNLTYTIVGASSVIILYYLYTYLRSGRSAELLRDRRVKVRLEDDTITFSSSESESSYKWSRIKYYWKLKDIIIVFPHGINLLMTPIPISSMTKEIEEFLVRKLSDNQKIAG